MHVIDIPQSVIDRVIRHRGREHVYDDLDARRTALIVVDMQNAFMMPGVAHVLCDTARDIVPAINRLAAATRASGGTVVWVKNTFGEPSLKTWPVFHAMTGPERTRVRIQTMAEGAIGHALWAGLEVNEVDLIVQKDRYSAFVPGASPLAEMLRERGLDTLLITGTVTNVCCDSTARDAMMQNFRTVMITDANAAHTDEEHNAALVAFYLAFGDIMSTDLAIQCLERSAGKTG
jgi:ureidoacrylate peracid hydrolase